MTWLGAASGVRLSGDDSPGWSSDAHAASTATGSLAERSPRSASAAAHSLPRLQRGGRWLPSTPFPVMPVLQCRKGPQSRFVAGRRCMVSDTPTGRGWWAAPACAVNDQQPHTTFENATDQATVRSKSSEVQAWCVNTFPAELSRQRCFLPNPPANNASRQSPFARMTIGPTATTFQSEYLPVAGLNELIPLVRRTLPKRDSPQPPTHSHQRPPPPQ